MPALPAGEPTSTVFWSQLGLGTLVPALSLGGMAEFVFDPPLHLKRGVTVRTLDDAADFARKYVGARLSRRRDGVLRRLEAASGYEEGRDAAKAFRIWAEAEGLLLDR